jgi:hypothetical protein
VQILRAILLMSLCAGLIFQVSAQASVVPQVEPMQMADCAKMMHHSEEQSAKHNHTDDSDGACKDMSLACMQAMNAVAPVWLGSDPAPRIAKQFIEPALYMTGYEQQLSSQISAPDYPPPRN